MHYRIRIVIAAVCTVLVLCGCQHTHQAGRDWYDYSAFNFRPERALRNHGFLVTTPEIKNGATDVVEECFKTSWYGVVTVPGDTNACEKVSQVIRAELDKALGARSKDDISYWMREGEPFWGSLNHDEAGARLNVQVWLIPHEQPSTMSYVIYLRSADLPK